MQSINLYDGSPAQIKLRDSGGHPDLFGEVTEHPVHGCSGTEPFGLRNALEEA